MILYEDVIVERPLSGNAEAAVKPAQLVLRQRRGSCLNRDARTISTPAIQPCHQALSGDKAIPTLR